MFFTCIFAFCLLDSREAQAGTIIKSPAYLGLQRGLVGCWTFDGSYTKAPDCSGNNNVGTLTGGPTKTAGKIGQALDFDGVDDSVEIPPASSINNLAALTWSGWLKIDDLSNSPTFADKGSFGGWTLSFSTNLLRFFKSFVGDLDILSVDTFSTGSWIHIAVTYSGGTSASSVKMYRDGIQIATSGSDGSGAPGSDTTNSFALGCGWNEGCLAGLFFSGLIDDVRLYNRALSDAEIAAIFKAAER